MEPGTKLYSFQHKRANYVTTPTLWTRPLINMWEALLIFTQSREAHLCIMWISVVARLAVHTYYTTLQIKKCMGLIYRNDQKYAVKLGS